MLTNPVCSFQKSSALEAGLTDFHKMKVAVLKSFLEKKQARTISYKYFEKFLCNHFEAQILREFLSLHISSGFLSLDLYVDICFRALGIYAPKR